MLDKFRELYDLKKKADAMKHQMEEIHLELEDRGIKLKLRGDNHIEQIIIDGTEDERIKDVVNKALKEVQKKVAKKMRGELGDLGIPGLK